MSDQVSDKDEMKEIIDEFIVEAYDLAEKAIQDIIAIENNTDEEIINSIFRAVHTIKGTSSFLGFGTLSTLAHRSEDIFGMVRKGNLKPDREVADVLLEALDLIKTLLDDIKENGAEVADTSATIAKLEDLAKPDRKKLGQILVEENIVSTGELTEALKKQEEQQDKKLGEILVEEKVITDGQLKDVLSKQKTHKEEQTIRIEVKKLDELMNLAGELVLGKNRLILLNSLVKKSEAKSGMLDNLADVTNYIEMVTNELQLSVMRARLVPISKLFNKIPRMARDLSAEFKKEIDLTMEGEETELDRSLIESLHDPLIHIIRNSVDHGVETPEEREKKGKPPKGTLSLKAYNEGNNVIIEIFDDGKGINVEAVKEKAREKGLIGENELNSLSPRDAMNLVFVPGLSTAKKVSNVSGRGVGMDVVKTNIEKMNGQVSIDSEEGQWTRISLRLPLTLAIMRALIVRVLDELFAIPLNTVTELVKREESLVRSVDKKEVLVLRDRVIPVVNLARVFSRSEGDEDKYIVICNIGEKTIGIKARAVEGQEEVVIKPLGEFLGNIKGIGGATIRGDGKAILILDMSALMDVVGTSVAAQNANRKIA
ncbi:MAG: chemotaxis protein CheA [Syntrophorhabdales bacterium]|jgi:two-component system chemotaxis sensor kinase CheA